MPYKSEKIKLSETQDRRRRLTEEQKQDIVKLYATGLYSWKTLATMYNVSKSLIGLTVNPKCAERVKQRHKEHWKDYQAKGKERNEAQKKTRRYKQELYLKGELKENTTNEC